MALIVTEPPKAAYINNPILLNFSENTPNSTVVHFNMRVTNANTQAVQNFRFQPNSDGQIKIDISPVLKSMFKVPKHNMGVGATENSGREVFNFVFGVTYTLPSVLVPLISTLTVNNRICYRGGLRGQYFNVEVPFLSILRSSEKLPVWPGYPSWEYRSDNTYNISQTIPGPTTNIERLKVKGCNPVYLKYMNSKGAYSFWLFEGETETMDTSNSGYSNTAFGIVDFGNTAEFDLQLYSKVPARYHGLMLDLIDSPEIYVYNPLSVSDQWIRIINDNNQMERGNFKKVYEVKLKFKRVANYNPQILWQ